MLLWSVFLTYETSVFLDSIVTDDRFTSDNEEAGGGRGRKRGKGRVPRISFDKTRLHRNRVKNNKLYIAHFEYSVFLSPFCITVPFRN